MKTEMVEKIKNDPNYIELVSKRTKFALILTVIMMVVYFAFILVIAFEPSLLGTPLSSDTVTTVGIPVGMGVIVFAFILTGIYTRRANSEFDDLTNKIKESVKDI